MEFGEVRILRVSGEMFREFSWWGFGERSEPRAILGGQQLALAEVSLKLIYSGSGRRPRSHPESRKPRKSNLKPIPFNNQQRSFSLFPM